MHFCITFADACIKMPNALLSLRIMDALEITDTGLLALTQRGHGHPIQNPTSVAL